MGIRPEGGSERQAPMTRCGGDADQLAAAYGVAKNTHERVGGETVFAEAIGAQVLQ